MVLGKFTTSLLKKKFEKKKAKLAALFKVFVVTLAGQTIPIEVEASDTLYNVKFKLYLNEGIPPEQQRLSFEGELLEWGRALSEYNIQVGSVLSLTITPRDPSRYSVCRNAKYAA
jgi:predicted transcriptional regulator